MRLIIIIISVLIGEQFVVGARKPQYDKSPATVEVYERGFAISVSEDRETNIDGIRFEGDLFASNGQKLISFNEITQAPVDGYWRYINNEFKLLPGDVVKYKIHVISTNIDKLREEHSYTVHSIFENQSTPHTVPVPVTTESSPQHKNPTQTVGLPLNSHLVQLAGVQPLIKDIFQTTNQTKASACKCSDTTPSSSSDSMITNQLKLILLHVQSSNEKVESLLEKVDALEEVLGGLISELPNTSNQLLLRGAPKEVVQVELLNEVHKFVANTLQLPALASSVLSASRIGDDILLNIRSTVEKLRILYRSQKVLSTSSVSLVDYVERLKPPAIHVPTDSTATQSNAQETVVPFDVRIDKQST